MLQIGGLKVKIQQLYFMLTRRHVQHQIPRRSGSPRQSNTTAQAVI